MVSLLLRRSGIAVVLIADHIQWKPDFIIQVGVGTTQQEMDVMKIAWPEMKAIGFEAHPRICEAMKDKFPGELVEVAIGSSEGTATLYYRKNHKDGSSLCVPNFDCHSMTVKTTTLDNAMKGRTVGEHNLLWIDCEGTELEVLKGGEATVEKAEVVNIEMTSKPVGKGWATPVQIHDWLNDHGFFRQWIHTQRSACGQVDGIYVRRHLFRPEYCCCPCAIKRFGEIECKDKSST